MRRNNSSTRMGISYQSFPRSRHPCVGSSTCSRGLDYGRSSEKGMQVRLDSPSIFGIDWCQINQRLHGSSRDFGLETTVYNKESVIDKSVTFVTMVLGVAMLIGPLWWLQHLTHNNLEARLGVITGFLVVFTILLSILTVARPFEVLAATAAYGAVLMVFMQIST